MSAVITLPVWLFALLGVLALWWTLERLLIPSVRWYLRRRLNRVIDELNVRLQLRMQPFKLTKRQVLIDRLLYDPEVVKAAERHADERGLRREEVMAEVERYAREIVPAFNAYAYFRVGYWIAKSVTRMLYRVRLGYADQVGLSRVPPDASVVFIMNHRSNMDYILVTYLVADRAALSYAVGEWARVWLLQTLVRALGAYFIRRDSRNALYRRVLARYVHMAVQGGVAQAVYPEGGLTRDGRLRPVKLGLLAYMVTSFDPAGSRDLVFIPVGINYDRVLEDRVQIARRRNGARARGKTSEILGLLSFLLHQLGLVVRARWYRFGYAGVGLGTPISMRDYLTERGLDFKEMEEGTRFAEVQRLAEFLMGATGQMVPVLPVSLVATVLVHSAGTSMSELELKARAQQLMVTLEAAGAHVYIPRADRDYAVVVGLRMLVLRHLVEERDGLYSTRPDELPLLRYYANSIAHLLEDG